MTILSLARLPLRRDGHLLCLFGADTSRLFAAAPRSGRFRRTAPLCGSHPLQRHKPADIVGEILQTDLGFRPHDTDRPYNPTARRGLLSTEHVLDASPNLALLVVRVLLRFR